MIPFDLTKEALEGDKWNDWEVSVSVSLDTYWYDTNLDSSDPDFFYNVILDSEYTCHNCGSNETCPWAWDDYNTSGDCLAEK